LTAGDSLRWSRPTCYKHVRCHDAIDPLPLDAQLAARDGDAVLLPIEPAPVLDALSAEARGRLVHFIVTSTLERGLAPTAVIALYADLAGEERAVRYADQRFSLKTVPDDWHDVENRVLDLEEGARARGVDLAAAWRRAMAVALRGQDPLEQLARLAGSTASPPRAQRSIFDDPEDLDTLDDVDPFGEQSEVLNDRLPDLVDLTDDAQRRLRRFAIEERLEHGLPPVELLELYRTLDVAGDARARQYLDRLYVEHEPPDDWLDVQREANRVLDLAESRGLDAGRLYAELLRGSPGLDPLVALRLVAERL
jgi:hypothetical protein